MLETHKHIIFKADEIILIHYSVHTALCRPHCLFEAKTEIQQQQKTDVSHKLQNQPINLKTQ